MKTIAVNFFGRGMANDIFSAQNGEFATLRNFDIYSYPNRLFPLPSMANDTSGTLIGNIIVGHDGNPYGVGDSGSPGGALYKRISANWSILSNSKDFGTVLYNFIVDYARNGSKYIFFAVKNGSDIIINAVDPVGNSSSQHTLSGATLIGQGFVHPKDQILYIPYQTASGTFIATYNGLGFETSGNWNATAFTLPSQYIVSGLTNYGDYLAIACATTTGGAVSNSSINSSVVFLWDRNPSNPLPNESIEWGDNSLQVLQNLNGVLIGVSAFLSNDYSTIQVKGYAGGEVELLEEISAIKQTSTSPTITINQNVNFIHRNRFYFSADIVGGSTSPVQKGLWAFGKNENGNWAVTVERFASTDGSDVSVLAAAYWFDYLLACHTSVGTLTIQQNTGTLSTDFGSPSIFESSVNPNMPDVDKFQRKQLQSVRAIFLPLTSSGQIVMKYRADSQFATDWKTMFTKTAISPTTDLAFYDVPKPISGQFRAGTHYDFRVESTGGAVFIGFLYTYLVLT